MSYVALYRKYRPSTFADVVGQEHVIKILKHQVSTGNVPHAYLFCGGRGTGKTSNAKILAKAINCLNPIDGEPCNKCEICKGINNNSIVDVVEIDAASNNSVDNIRSIIDEVNYAPTIAKYKVYIIDEVHMLSTGAFNALLKTLEEPPHHVVFILATTEPHKLLPTIISRCQRFEFRRFNQEDIAGRLKLICDESDIQIDAQALSLLAKTADGAMRDGISLLDQCISSGENHITFDTAKNILGIMSNDIIKDILHCIINSNIVECIKTFSKIIVEGKDVSQFVWELIKFLRDILIYKATQNGENIYNSDYTSDIQAMSQKFEVNSLLNTINTLSELEQNIKYSTQPAILVEATLIKLCSNAQNLDYQGILNKIAELEKNMQNPSVKRQSLSAAIPQSTSTPKQATKRVPSILTNSNAFTAWPEVISMLKSSGKITLYGSLMNTKAVILDQDNIGVVFDKDSGNFGKSVLEKPDNMAILKELTNRILGYEVNIKCVDETKDIDISEPLAGLEKKVKELNVPFDVLEE